jgi:hypothetical protein
MANVERRMPISDARRKAVWGGRVRLAAVALAAVVLPSCSDAIRTGQSPAYLVLTSLTATKGGGSNSGTPSNTLASDVVTLVPAKTGTPTVFSDSGTANLVLQMKDTTLTPSPVNAITLTQYHVNFIRADGRNTPGVDVPFGFDGVLGTTISGSGAVSFTLVRVQSKVEAPLAALANNFQVISMIAEVTLYGHDQNGRDVSVSGRINVDFSDWGD